MGWEFWVNVALVIITISSFIVTAIVYHRQNKIIAENARITNFYSLYSYLGETKFFESMVKQGKSDIREGFNSYHGALILEAANLITEEYLNHKIDPLLFEVSLKVRIGSISIQAFSDKYGDINDKTSNINAYPYLYKFYLLEGRKMFPSIS